MPHYLITIWDTLIGIVIAVVSFVCSVGNIVMAAALWHGGIAFAGVVAYILADLVTIPMLAVYKSYYGNTTMLKLLACLSISIFITALLVDAGFSIAGLTPHPDKHQAMQMPLHLIFEWNYKTILNLVFIPLSVIYFLWGKKQGGMSM